jgi:hypothetical protein
MIKLEDTKIYRAGVTASELEIETNQCSLEITRGGALDLRLRLNSKGGGQTSVSLEPSTLAQLYANLTSDVASQFSLGFARGCSASDRANYQFGDALC